MLATGKIRFLSACSLHRPEPEPESRSCDSFLPLDAAYPTCFDTSFARFLNNVWSATPLPLNQRIKMSQPFFTYPHGKNENTH